MIKLVLFQGCKDVSIYVKQQEYIAHKFNQGQISQEHLNRCKKYFDKIQHFIMIKALKKLQIEESYLIITSATYDKLTANIILNWKKLKVFPPKSGSRQECHSSQFLSNTILEFLASTIRQEKEIKRM
jgi:hypothetical protein